MIFFSLHIPKTQNMSSSFFFAYPKQATLLFFSLCFFCSSPLCIGCLYLAPPSLSFVVSVCFHIEGSSFLLPFVLITFFLFQLLLLNVIILFCIETHNLDTFLLCFELHIFIGILEFLFNFHFVFFKNKHHFLFCFNMLSKQLID